MVTRPGSTSSGPVKENYPSPPRVPKFDMMPYGWGGWTVSLGTQEDGNNMNIKGTRVAGR